MNKNNARFILVTNWLVKWHWGQETWAIMEMLRQSPRNHSPGRRHPAAPNLKSELWWIKCAEASTNLPPVSCTHQWNSFHARPSSYQHRLTTGLCSLNFWRPHRLTGKHALLWFNQPLVGRALWLTKNKLLAIGLNHVSLTHSLHQGDKVGKFSNISDKVSKGSFSDQHWWGAVDYKLIQCVNLNSCTFRGNLKYMPGF